MISTASHNEVTRIRFTHLPDTTKKKNGQDIENMVYKTLYIRQQMTIIMERQEANQVRHRRLL